MPCSFNKARKGKGFRVGDMIIGKKSSRLFKDEKGRILELMGKNQAIIKMETGEKIHTSLNSFKKFKK